MGSCGRFVVTELGSGNTEYVALEDSSAEVDADENESGGNVDDPIDARLGVGADGLDGSTVGSTVIVIV